MKTLDLFGILIRQTRTGRFLLSFLIVYVVCCVLIWMIDPSIQTLPDAFWFGFMIITTIGFGDFTVVSPMARLVTGFLGLYGVLAVGFICGTAASWFYDHIRAGKEESLTQMLWKLEHLDDLDDHELVALQTQAKAHGIHIQSETSQRAGDCS